jgi:hypothetical protein
MLTVHILGAVLASCLLLPGAQGVTQPEFDCTARKLAYAQAADDILGPCCHCAFAPHPTLDQTGSLYTLEGASARAAVESDRTALGAPSGVQADGRDATRPRAGGRPRRAPARHR